MNFAGFQNWREQCLRTQPGLLDCGETNLYRALAAWQPQFEENPSPRRFHRCDLARLWLNRYSFPEDWSRRALVNRGVRHALALIFSEIARTGAALWLPEDVYPTYIELAHAAGCQPKLFPTLPQPNLPKAQCVKGREYLLATNPWKPLGRFIDEVECAALRQWLDGSPERWLLLDCVYDLGTPFHKSAVKLMETGRVVLLHSVTKGWLWPKTFGVALLGEPWPELENAFRADPPTQEQLRLADRLLSRDADLPSQITVELARRKEQLLTALPADVADALLNDVKVLAPGCYLFPVKLTADDLLRQHRIIALPASAFGASWNGSILTSLAAPIMTSGRGGVP